MSRVTLKNPDSRTNHTPAPSLNGTHARQLLIVDDNELTCKQLQKLLQTDSALKVEYQTDSQQALEALQHTNYSILVTDLCMPKLSGMELIQQIQARNLPVTVIVTTGHGSINEAVQ